MRLGRDDATLWTKIIPTSYVRAWKVMQDLLRKRPQGILMFGFSRNATGLRLARYARNEDRAKARDNDGRTGRARIVNAAPNALSATARVDELHRQLLAANVPASVSEDAGGFVCNHVYFRTLEALARESAPNARCLFVHVGDWQGTADQDDVIRGAKLLVRAIAGADEGEDAA